MSDTTKNTLLNKDVSRHPSTSLNHAFTTLSIVIAVTSGFTGCGNDTGSTGTTMVDTVAVADSGAGQTGADAQTADTGAVDTKAADTKAADTKAADTTGSATATDATTAKVAVTVANFNCITDWAKVNRFRIKSLTGQLDKAIAVAKSKDGGTYPAGTMIQLIPTEAMVKHEKGWNASTKDWEFFFLNVTAKKTEISARGTTEVVNGFGGNCFSCHNKAKAKWDLLCEQDHGCDKLPFSASVIESIQNGDPRCVKK